MFSNAITTFRRKTSDAVCTLDDTDFDKNYEICSNFLDEYAHDDNEDICALNDYITFGQDGEGIFNKRLLTILAGLCGRYINTTRSVINNQSYCNSSITSFERAEHYIVY